MSVGQRISQKRKEQGLSQEALGEALGVSRQSVYKWESDSTLPEIDKLIALSKLFGVTIGWLLGVEEPVESREGDPAPPTEAGEAELTETQLKMVEEIVDRYLAAQQPPKKRRWPWVLGAAAGLVLLVVLSNLRGELRTMRDQYNNLQSSITNVTYSVDSQIGSIASRVESVLKNQNSLTVSYGAEILSADLAANTVTFSAYAAPKTYTEGMTAVFLADDGSNAVEVPGQLGENQTFSAQLTCALTDGINISVVFVTGEVRETQLLENYSYLYTNSLPDAMDYDSPASSMMWLRLNDQGELNWTGLYVPFRRTSYVDNSGVGHSTANSAAVNGGIGRSEARSVQVGLFRNQKLLGWLTPCEQPANYRGFEDCDFYSFPDVSVVPEAGDIFTVSTVIVDEYDREFVVRGVPYTMNDEFKELVHADGGWIGVDDPANWEY